MTLPGPCYEPAMNIANHRTLTRALFFQPLTSEWVSAAVALDQQALGGLWTANGYQREIDSPNGLLFVLSTALDPMVSAGAEIQGFPQDLPDPSLKPSQREGDHRVGDQTLLGFGCLWMILDEAHITLLVIDAPYRRQGLGQVLLAGLLEAAQYQGMERATLEVRASNEGAIALYTAYGFREAGRRKRYYQNPEEDACILWRGGLQSPSFAAECAAWKQNLGDRLQQNGWHLENWNEKLG